MVIATPRSLPRTIQAGPSTMPTTMNFSPRTTPTSRCRRAGVGPATAFADGRRRDRRRAGGVVALLALLAMTAEAALAQEPRLRYELQVEPASSPGSVSVVFRLFNDGADAVRVLTWQTPLEGIRGRIFTVRCAGSEVAYRGAMIKRGAPRAEHFVSIEPGRSVQGKVDLASAYALPAA